MDSRRPLAIATADELRRDFDRVFAEAPASNTTPYDDLLGLTVGGNPYAVRLSHVGGLYSDRKVTWLPGSAPELLGLLGLRGAIFPAYDLRRLLGYARDAVVPRWFFVMADAPAVLGFEQFDGHLRVPRESIRAAHGSASDGQRGIREVVHAGDLVRPIVHVPSVFETITALARRTASPKE